MTTDDKYKSFYTNCLPQVLFLRALDTVGKLEELGVKTNFLDLRTKLPALYAQVQKFFFENKINLYNVNDKTVPNILLTYDNYLSYLVEICTAHSLLAQKQVCAYAMVIDACVSQFVSKFLNPVDFYEAFAINCLQSILEFLVECPVGAVNFQESTKQFFNKVISLTSYFKFMEKLLLNNSFHYKLLASLLPKLATHFKSHPPWARVFTFLYMFVTRQSNLYTQDLDFKEYYTMYFRYVSNLEIHTRIKYQVKGQDQMHLLSRLKLAYAEIFQRYLLC